MSKFQNSPAATINLHRFNLLMFGQLALAALILLGVTLTTGCSTLPSSLSSNGTFSDSAQAPVASGSQAQYLVDMQFAYGGGKKFKGNIGHGTTVQTAIEASGAVKKFRKMDVAVMRNIEGDFQPLKMTSNYNSNKRRISSETDYALQHGDRIVITPRAENKLLQAFGTLADGK